jgi:proton-dependent oligopeptide transporter, POT family
MTDAMAPRHGEKGWFGHPKGLSTLFFTEMWERFSYYGMRALLLLFMVAPVASGGFGWDAAKAGPIYGLYTAMAFFTSLPGGWIADRILGQRRAVMIGGIIIALGHISLMFHSLGTFYLGLALITIGTGLLKPNISTMVGELYSVEDRRRDAGFSIFYMGINVGAFLAPLVCGYLAQHADFQARLIAWGIDPKSSWHWGFGAAAVGMTLGVIQYVVGGKRLGEAGLKPATPGDARALRSLWIGLAGTVGVLGLLVVLHRTGIFPVTIEGITQVMGYALVVVPFLYFGMLFAQGGWTAIEKKRLLAIFAFFVLAALFWSAFEQAGSTLNLFAERFTKERFLGLEFPASWYQSLNSLFIIFGLAPFFAWLWIRLREKEPSSPTKFGIGLLFVGLGFAVMIYAAKLSGVDGVRVSGWWLTACYLLHTIGELCLSPVGLSTMTKLAPARINSQIMGIWFLASSVGNFVGGQVAAFFETFPLPELFGAVFVVCMVLTVVAFALIKPIRRLMGGVH